MSSNIRSIYPRTNWPISRVNNFAADFDASAKRQSSTRLFLQTTGGPKSGVPHRTPHVWRRPNSSDSFAIFAAILRASPPERLEQSMGGGVFSKDGQGTVFKF